MTYHIIIPSRFASTRLPAKPLADIAGKPMIQHVYERALQAGAQSVTVATDDRRIMAACQSFGAPVIMTAASHESGTDRLHEAAQQLKLNADDIVVNVQGDEPLIPSAVITQVAENLARNPDCAIATLSAPLQLPEQLFEASVVKVVADKAGKALYFSRSAIPHSRKEFPSIPNDLSPWQRHIGIYAYRVRFLQQFVSWPMAPLEKLESLEQLRALWNGERIHVETAKVIPPAGVDTPEDLERVRAILR